MEFARKAVRSRLGENRVTAKTEVMGKKQLTHVSKNNLYRFIKCMIGSSYKEHIVDSLAIGADEGRGKLR